VISLIFLPIVTGETRQGFEAFAVENQGWFKEGLELQGDIAKGQMDEQPSIEILEQTWKNSNPGTLAVPKHILGVNGTGLVEVSGDGPFAVWWQFAPVCK
jgi:hypothetical protein